jgi:hypothetical protein
LSKYVVTRAGTIPEQLRSEQRYHRPLSVLPVKLFCFGSKVQSFTVPVHACSHNKGVLASPHSSGNLLYSLRMSSTRTKLRLRESKLFTVCSPPSSNDV